jgi:hypothetical protein
MQNYDFTYKWNLSDLKNVKPNGMKVFSCFSCGGGSSMGYKIALEVKKQILDKQ